MEQVKMEQAQLQEQSGKPIEDKPLSEKGKWNFSRPIICQNVPRLSQESSCEHP